MKIHFDAETLAALKRMVEHIRQQRLMDYVMYDLPPNHPNCPTYYGKSLAESWEELTQKRVIRDAEIDGGE